MLHMTYIYSMLNMNDSYCCFPWVMKYRVLSAHAERDIYVFLPSWIIYKRQYAEDRWATLDKPCLLVFVCLFCFFLHMPCCYSCLLPWIEPGCWSAAAIEYSFLLLPSTDRSSPSFSSFLSDTLYTFVRRIAWDQIVSYYFPSSFPSCFG